MDFDYTKPSYEESDTFLRIFAYPENLKYEILRNIKFQEFWEAFRIVDKVWLYRLGRISAPELAPR